MMVMVMNMFVDDFFHRVRYLFNQFFHDNFFDWDVLYDFDWIRLCVKKIEIFIFKRSIMVSYIFNINPPKHSSGPKNPKIQKNVIKSKIISEWKNIDQCTMYIPVEHGLFQSIFCKQEHASRLGTAENQ